MRPAMIIVGEKINTSRKKIAEAVEQRDAEFIVQVAQEQADAGAHYIDVNAGTFLLSSTVTGTKLINNMILK